MKLSHWTPIVAGVALLFGASNGRAQGDLIIYSDAVLTNAFQDWSWASHNLNNASPVHGGTRSISVNANAWEGISFYHPEIELSPYSSFTFWVNGGLGGQRLQVYAETSAGTGPTYSLPSALSTSWQQITIPLSALGISNALNFNRITIQLRNDGTATTFYLDDIQFAGRPVPVTVNVSVAAGQTLRTVDERHFGVNLAMWDMYYDPPNNTTTAALLQEMGVRTVRMPGGSLSDEYHWASNTTLTNTWTWQASFSDMVRVITNVGVQAFIVVNYGTGTPEEAAGWVRHSNVTNHLGYKYWEIGNECYGDWETDTNSNPSDPNVNPHDPYTYATRAADYIAQMRAADSNILIGVVSAPGENSFSNQFTLLHPAFNSRTGKTTYGWTPIMLTRLKSLGVQPDFLIHHHYPQYTDPNNPSASNDNDANLLMSTGNWTVQSADLRQQITDYYGAGGSNIQLVVTENNSDAGAQGRQSTSLVNGVYYAESLARLLRTEFNGFVWWDFRNGTDNGGFFSSALYGWRNYGDLGVINNLNTRHPAFYAAKLMQWFARPGDQVLDAVSDYAYLTVTAARRANGAISLLAINKSLTTNLNTSIALSGFTPSTSATVRWFGIPNDEAARTNGPAAAKDITQTNAAAGSSFGYNFPPLSMTVFTLTPAAPSLAALPLTPVGEFVLQLQGQPSVPYVVEHSTNLMDWQAVSTNLLTSTTLNITNSPPLIDDQQYWRAVWKP